MPAHEPPVPQQLLPTPQIVHLAPALDQSTALLEILWSSSRPMLARNTGELASAADRSSTYSTVAPEAR